METRLKSKRIGPLPGGDRRGAPGADAGCGSIRTVSGEELNRRAPSGSLENATANLNSEQQTAPIATPALDVAQGVNTLLPASTKAGKPRVRMRWTEDVNIFIMRTYYRVTKLETDMTTYRKLLHEHFLRQYPHVMVSEQRVSDQRRVIIRNRMLTNEKLEQIKEEVRLELEQVDISLHTQPSLAELQIINSTDQTPRQTVVTSTQSPYNYLNATETQTPFSTHVSTQTETTILLMETEIETLQTSVLPDSSTEKFKENLQTAIIEFAGLDPTLRPRLPKLKYSLRLAKLTQFFNNTLLPEFFTDESQLTDIHTLIYCSALVITRELGYNTESQPKPQRINKKPAWQDRLERDITQLRSNIGRLTQYLNNNRSKKIVDTVNKIITNNRIHTGHDNNNKRPEDALDTLKQKLALKSHRLARYKKALQRKNDNKLFHTNEKIFYRNLNTNKENLTNSNIETPAIHNLEEFWAGIWETEVHHNEEAPWITEEERKWEGIDEMQFKDITESDIRFVTSRLHNWKSPGIDRIHNYWYKKFTTLHKIIAKNFTSIIHGQQSTPPFIAKGITYMLPKGKYTSQPSQYRPITCLPTIYKILTSAIAQKLTTHIEQHSILAEEQKGCRRDNMGCKEQLIIDSVIHRHAATNKRNLHCTYIDYKKAFDSIPHSWLLYVLKIYKINPVIIDFLKNIMPLWKTTLHLNTITSREIVIKKGIYQGDSLSPLWFCLALNPISQILQNCKAGYRLKHDSTETCISHLIYMDDIKLYSKTAKEMKSLIDAAANFSKNIGMQFGLDKCKTIHIAKGKIQPGNYTVSLDEIITAMEPNELYKYLGYQQSKGIDHNKLKSSLRDEYKHRVHILSKSNLAAKNLIKAINTYAIPILTYSFGIIKWTKTDINNIQIATRTILTKHNCLHPKSAIERVTIKRQDGGRGLIDIFTLWTTQISKLRSFFFEKASSSQIHKAIVSNDLNHTPLNLTQNLEVGNVENNSENCKIEQWKKKTLHGRHPQDLEQPHIDKSASNKWLTLGFLFPETEGFIIAIQDQIINTKNYKKHIIKDSTVTDDRCRKCHNQPETIQHITGACPNLAQTDYTHRHNQIANIIHQRLALKYELIPDTHTPYYQYTPKTVLENSTHKIYYDRAILTDRTIHYNRPDITVRDKINKITYLIDIAVPNTHNLQKTIAEKIHKYADLRDEVLRIWKQQKVYIVPLVLSTTGVIPKHIHHGLKLLDLKPNTYILLQKAAILNTCRIVRKFLQIEYDQPHNAIVSQPQETVTFT